MENKILPQEEIEEYFVRCEFDDECDLCDEPEHGSYAAGYSNDENGCEVDYYLCGKCASAEIPELKKGLDDLDKYLRAEQTKIDNQINREQETEQKG